MGRLFDRLLDLEFDIKNFGVGWDEITCEEVRGLQILQDERHKWGKELEKRDEDERRMR